MPAELRRSQKTKSSLPPHMILENLPALEGSSKIPFQEHIILKCPCKPSTSKLQRPEAHRSCNGQKRIEVAIAKNKSKLATCNGQEHMTAANQQSEDTSSEQQLPHELQCNVSVDVPWASWLRLQK
jgi:hypothetical protein